MKCPVCGAAELIHDKRDLPYTYKGETTIIPDVVADYCHACGESITDYEETGRVMAAMNEFKQQVDEQSINPKYILDVRRKLNLSQQQAGALFGGGVNAFSRYETGKTKPPLALVQLFRLLNEQPELLHKLK